MAYEFKKLSEVEIVESLSDEASVLVEDGGEVKRVEKKKVTPVKVSELENDAGYIHAPATAEVGQVIAVKAVDENGRPTEWEAVDAGGSVDYDLVIKLENSSPKYASKSNYKVESGNYASLKTAFESGRMPKVAIHYDYVYNIDRYQGWYEAFHVDHTAYDGETDQSFTINFMNSNSDQPEILRIKYYANESMTVSLAGATK